MKLQVKITKEIQAVIDILYTIPQRPDYHPEGNVGIHTDIVRDRVFAFNDPTIYIAAIFHDFGKIDTTEFNEKKGHYTSYQHELYSLHYVKKFRDWIEANSANFDDVYYLVKNHMKAHQVARGQIKKAHKLEAWKNHLMYQRSTILGKADDMLRVWTDNDGEEIIC